VDRVEWKSEDVKEGNNNNNNNNTVISRLMPEVSMVWLVGKQLPDSQTAAALSPQRDPLEIH